MIPATKELLDFSGKTVIVTGASQGIGAGIASRFAEAGANVVVHYRGSEAGANAVVETITGKGGEAVAIKAELSKADACESLVAKTLEAFSGLDALVNNAGIFPNAPLLELSLEDWRAMYSGSCS